MHTVQAVSAAFCLACICAEAVTLLVGGGWARRCIKALAGLYILVVLLQLLPAAQSLPEALTQYRTEPAALPGLEQQVLAAAQERLQAQLEADCLEQFGLSAQVQIALVQDGQQLRAEGAQITAAPGSSTEACSRAVDYLRQQLGVEPILACGEEGGA